MGCGRLLTGTVGSPSKSIGVVEIQDESEQSDHLVTRVDYRRWLEAQRFETEFAHSSRNERDDWNLWWRDQFEGYEALAGRKFPRVLEVGAGPNTNMRLIAPLVELDHLFLEDPLMMQYLAAEFQTPSLRASLRPRQSPSALVQLVSESRFAVDLSSAMLESLPHRTSSIDLLVCINVLDHVQDADQCLDEMRRVLGPDGILVLGQDLSNEEDLRLAPDSYEDIGHPIKVDDVYLDRQIGDSGTLFSNILPREAGRNPSAHFGTYLFIGTMSGS